MSVAFMRLRAIVAGALSLALSLALATACRRVERSEIATPIRTSGPAARELLARPGFAWRTLTTPIARIHVVEGSAVQRILPELADSIADARKIALLTLREPEIDSEPKLELFLVDTREDMQRLMGRPIGGFAQPGELTAAFVAGPGYHPFLRHELTHAYASVRWGSLAAGEWLTEGLAALAQGTCQGHTIDELAAGFLANGEVPPLTTLTKRFRDLPELPSYMAAASAAGFLERASSIDAVRALWRSGSTGGHPLGPNGEALESRWRSYLRTLTPASLDTLRLRREGC